MSVGMISWKGQRMNVFAHRKSPLYLASTLDERSGISGGEGSEIRNSLHSSLSFSLDLKGQLFMSAHAGNLRKRTLRPLTFASLLQRHVRVEELVYCTFISVLRDFTFSLCSCIVFLICLVT